MSSPPVVTVITPTKNRCSLLMEAIASVAAQSFSDWEHIIVDDGSDDGTVEMASNLATADPRIRYLQREAYISGANACRNQGLAEARGEFIVFLDSDDLLDPHCLSQRVDVMCRNADLDFATYCSSVFCKARGDIAGQTIDNSILGDDLLKFLYFEVPWIITSPIWRRTSLNRLGGFDESLLSWQDIDLHIRALVLGFHYIRFSDIDHHVRWSWDLTRVSVQQRLSPKHLMAASRTLIKFEELIQSGPGFNWSRQRALCGSYFFCSERWVEIDKPHKAQSFWRQARCRGLCPAGIYFSGAFFLALIWISRFLGGAMFRLCQRIVHKWKGLVRMRLNPELVN